MLSAIMTVARRARAARRNYRILSDLDDATLRDIGLERLTLRRFCDEGCVGASAPKREAHAQLPVLMPRTLRPALR